MSTVDTSINKHATLVLAHEHIRMPLFKKVVESFAHMVNITVDRVDDLAIAVDEGVHVIDMFGSPDAPITLHVNSDQTLGLSVTLDSEANEGVTEALVENLPTYSITRTLVDASILQVKDGRLQLTFKMRAGGGA